jgi:hypothetical protein
MDKYAEGYRAALEAAAIYHDEQAEWWDRKVKEADSRLTTGVIDPERRDLLGQLQAYLVQRYMHTTSAKAIRVLLPPHKQKPYSEITIDEVRKSFEWIEAAARNAIRALPTPEADTPVMDSSGCVFCDLDLSPVSADGGVTWVHLTRHGTEKCTIARDADTDK